VKAQEHRLKVSDRHQVYSLLGPHDRHLEIIQESFDVKIVTRGDELVISGPPDQVDLVSVLVQKLLDQTRQGGQLSEPELRYAIRLVREGTAGELDELGDEHVLVTARGKRIQARTLGQKNYIRAMQNHSLVFGIGPAGTGKTYLAVALAVAAFRARTVSRIILTRPAVEAGEKLGFLPGDIQEKVNPYLRPLYDALFDILGADTFDKYMQRGLVEVAPLAYMRGRTLDDAFIILDEAQNTTPEQMKMFLTRMGIGSRAVVTGDITQIDLPKGSYSGLEQVRVVLKDVEGIAFVYLSDRDVVRHSLVQRVVLAYERFGLMQGGGGNRESRESP
jgi:phosphate starvation-inducible PhoH-like protein